jgi:hypothetical protein
MVMQKYHATQLLEKGLFNNLGYGDGYLIEEFFENFDSACIELDFILLLKVLASRESINFQDEDYFDDNSSGGFLHPTEAGKSFETEAFNAIQTIKDNFENLSPTVKKFVTGEPKTFDSILDEIITGDIADSDLIPILENIAREDVYLISSPSRRGFGALSKTVYLGEKAGKAIKVIKKNIRKGKL